MSNFVKGNEVRLTSLEKDYTVRKIELNAHLILFCDMDLLTLGIDGTSTQSIVDKQVGFDAYGTQREHKITF